MEAGQEIMTVSGNGQVSIPAAVRNRWNAKRVIVVDLGDRVVIRPLRDDPVQALQGAYRGMGPSSDEARSQARDEETDQGLLR